MPSKPSRQRNTKGVMYSASEEKKKTLPGSSAGLSLYLLLPLWICFFFSSPSFFVVFEGMEVRICSEGETCCYCTKTSRINLTSRGSGAETSLTTAAGPGDGCSLPNQAALLKMLSLITAKRRVKVGFSRGNWNNWEIKGSIFFFFFFQ